MMSLSSEANDTNTNTNPNPEEESASSTADDITTNNDKALSSWRSLLEVTIAKTRNIRGSNYVQLSTVDENGEPRCRTIVFRGFLKLPPDHILYNTCDDDDKSCIMKMCTHLQSKKVDQNKHQSIAEMVWWFPKTSEQYRIRGTLHLLGNDNNNNDETTKDDKSLEIARKELWGNVTDAARESFLSSAVPGECFNPLSDTTESIPPGGRNADGKLVPPPDNFLLMLLNPTHVDYLCLTGSQYRQIDERGASGTWSMKRVNP